jgi:hypothetical protein
VDLSVVAAFLLGQQAQTQLALAAKFARMNADNARATAQLVDAASKNIERAANLASGVGQNLDVSV